MRIIWLYFICFVTAGLEILWQIFKIIYVYDFGKEYIRISIMKMYSNKFEGRGTIYLTEKNTPTWELWRISLHKNCI